MDTGIQDCVFFRVVVDFVWVFHIFRALFSVVVEEFSNIVVLVTKRVKNGLLQVDTIIRILRLIRRRILDISVLGSNFAISEDNFDFVIVDIVLIKVPRRHRNRNRIRISIRRWSNKLLVLKVTFFFSEKLLFQESVFESLSQKVGVDDL